MRAGFLGFCSTVQPHGERCLKGRTSALEVEGGGDAPVLQRHDQVSHGLAHVGIVVQARQVVGVYRQACERAPYD